MRPATLLMGELTRENSGKFKGANRIIEMLERAEIETDPVHRQSQLTFVVGGAGFSGVETAGEVEDFVRRVRRRTSGIKRLLLDQGLVSGVGNIYADEALWRARLHFERRGDRLPAAKVRELLEHARAVMGEALHQGGTSFDALYVNVNGESGYFDRSLEVYGQEGRPCSRCGTPIVRVPFTNRSSFTCPRCQPVPRPRN